MDKHIDILLIEDDKVDVMTIERAFRELNINNPLHIMSNGEEGLAFLKDNSNPRPGLILLDLNMPRMNGIELLEIIKKDEVLRSIPVVILTTSQAENDRFECYNLSVAGYMIKPVDYVQFVEVISAIYQYWTLCELHNPNQI